MIIGTAGHIDHGKTSLVKAITGVDADRLKEEKARGISIDLGFAYWPQADGATIGFVDVPGHERFIHTMLAGAQGIDFALLIVAADDGVMPQTREHVDILSLLGIGCGLVALTKADLVDEERLAVVRGQIETLLAGTPLGGSPIIPVSSVTGAGLDDLTSALRAASQDQAARSNERAFRLAIDRSFTLAGAGTVVTGTVLDGEVRVGDQVIVSPKGLTARIRAIHAQNRPAEIGRAGDRCALNLAGPGIAKDAISRGDIVLAPALHAPTQRIDARLSILPGEPKALTQWMPARLHHGAAEVGARLVLLSDEPPRPDTTTEIQLVLDRPIAAAALDRFVLRDASASRTIGGGIFLDLRPPERKRRTPERAALRAAYSLSGPGEALQSALAAPGTVIDLMSFARDRGFEPASATEWLDGRGILRLPSEAGEIVLSASGFADLREKMIAHLSAFHAAHPDLSGQGFERLRLAIGPRIAAPVFRAIARRLVEAGDIALQGGWARLAGHVVTVSPKDEALWARIMPALTGDERYRPPRVRDFAQTLGEPEEEIRALFKRFARAGTVDEVAHDHYFARTALAELVRIADEMGQTSENGWFTAAQYRDRIDIGRKVAIHILECLDKHGVTIRRGDLRRINRHRADLFEVDRGAISGREASLVGRPDFKSGWGRETVLGGFDSHSLPPSSAGARDHDPSANRHRAHERTA